MARKLRFRDLTLRDGQQSLFATRLSQSEIDKLLPFYEDAGFYIMEVWGGAVPDSVMRYLDESPWNRLRTISKAMDSKSAHPKSLLSALSRGRNLFGYVPYPDSVLEGFYKEAIKNGLNIMRIFDALNDINNVKESIRLINQLGGIADGAVCYTVDPKDEEPAVPVKKGFFARLFGGSQAPAAPKKIFTDQYFVDKAKAMEALGAKIITLKDMAGLVTPSRAASIIGRLKQEVEVPVDFHTHCTPGYGLASSLMAVLHGVDILDTNIWWFGGGSAAPAIELIYVFCKKLGIEMEVNMEAVGRIRKQLLGARKSLAAFDLHKDKMPREFDPLNDKLPANIDSLFDTAISCAKNGDESGLLDACHAIEDYFGFPKPNEIVKFAEVPGGMYSNMVAQLKAVGAEELLDASMKLIPKVRRDAGLVPLVTPTSQIVGSQAVSLAIDRKKGNPDYTTKSNQFISLVKGEYGKTPVEIDPAFRQQITGSAEERDYDTSSYRRPDNPVMTEFGGVKLAKDDEEYLLMELLPAVATGFLKNRRKEEAAAEAAKAPKAEAAAAKAEPVAADAPVTGPVERVPMPGTVLDVKVKAGDTVKRGQPILVYEAMKMENEVQAGRDGKVRRVFMAEGDRVAGDAMIIEYEA